MPAENALLVTEIKANTPQRSADLHSVMSAMLRMLSHSAEVTGSPALRQSPGVSVHSGRPRVGVERGRQNVLI